MRARTRPDYRSLAQPGSAAIACALLGVPAGPLRDRGAGAAEASFAWGTWARAVRTPDGAPPEAASRAPCGGFRICRGPEHRLRGALGRGSVGACVWPPPPQRLVQPAKVDLIVTQGGPAAPAAAKGRRPRRSRSSSGCPRATPWRSRADREPSRAREGTSPGMSDDSVHSAPSGWRSSGKRCRGIGPSPSSGTRTTRA